MVTTPRSLVPPTIPSKSMLPVPAVRPRVSVWSVVPSRVLANVIVPAPVSVFKVVAAVSVVAPRSISVLVVATVPATLTAPAAASKPPVNVLLSVASLPMVVVPVFKKLVSLSITFVAPCSVTAYPRPKVIMSLLTTLPANVTAPVAPAMSDCNVRSKSPPIEATLIAPVPLFNVELAVIVVAPKSIWVSVVATVPDTLTAPAVASKPPVN